MGISVDRTVDNLKQKRLDRMRLGQSVGTIKALLSEPEILVSLVPLTEAEHLQCVEIIVRMDVPETIAGAMARDRRNSNEVLYRAIREPGDLTQKMFSSVEEMTENLSVDDINFLQDEYFAMLEEVNPTAAALTDDEIETLKKVFREMDWSALSGKQWFALRRFLSTIGLAHVPDNSLGSTSTSLLTTMNEEGKSTLTASPSGNDKPAKSVETP